MVLSRRGLWGVTLAALLQPSTSVDVVSQQLELVVGDIEDILNRVEDVANENALTYRNFVNAEAGGCNPRLGLACFDPSNSFSTLTQYLMFSQIYQEPAFAFVNLNEKLSDAAWGFSGWAQDLSGSRYYFSTDEQGHTDCFFPSSELNPSTLNLSAPAFGFDYNPINDSYIQKPLLSGTGESWTPVYPFNITAADGGWTIDIFASYGVYDSTTETITSVDIDLEMVDAFTKALDIDHSVATIFVVEPSTGTLVAVSQPSVDTHQHDSYDLNLAVNSTYAPVAAATEAYGDLTDGEEARAFEVTADGVIYVVNTRLLTGHTGSGWLVFEVTDAVESNDCTCAGGQSEMYSNCTCYTEDRDRVDLVEEEIDSIMDEVERMSAAGARTYDTLQASPTHSASSFDTMVRFVLFSQLESPLDFAFVNLNTEPAPGEWALNGWALDSGTQYYYDTESQTTNCWYAEPNTLNFSASPDISFSYNSVNDSYIQSPLNAASKESWTSVYPWLVYNADGSTQVNLFASYGVYSNSTGTISSADLELEVLDRFVKKIGVELASKPSRDSVVFIVEAATGVLVAVSDADTETHDGWNVFQVSNATNNAIAAAAAGAYGSSFDDGVAEKDFETEIDGKTYSIRAKRTAGHTGLDWVVFQATGPMKGEDDNNDDDDDDDNDDDVTGSAIGSLSSVVAVVAVGLAAVLA